MTEQDVCLLLEGTYPYVRGGVSSWLDQLIRGLPEFNFSIVFIGGQRVDYGEPQYQLPPNVTHLEAHYLEDGLDKQEPRVVKVSKAAVAPIESLHEYLQARASQSARGSLCVEDGGSDRASHSVTSLLERAVDEVMVTLERPGGLCIRDFLFGTESWNIMRAAHLDNQDPNASFVDYFWALRLLHGPIFQLARIAHTVPPARVFHTISTGYAGLLGAFLERRRKRPLILSEHGIYTKERRIDLNQAEWHDSMAFPGAPARNQALRELWIRSFESMGRLIYRSANPVISLYAANRERQHQDGASPERTRIIANGIDLERFGRARMARPVQTPAVVALVGRIVPIKDIKTFIRAVSVLVRGLPEAEGWIVGGSEEGAAYAEECRALVESLGLVEKVKFLGHKNVVEILPQVGIMMLSSISEAQPLVLLEAFAAGVPCISTDVGSCRELIEGTTAEDRALGPAGEVVPFADHEALGRAAVSLLADPQRWQACQDSAHARVHKYYGQRTMLNAYREVYQNALETPWQA